MIRQADCGRPEALARYKIATTYWELAEVSEAEDSEASRNVAAGNAVLAAIAAADAICCAELGARHRGQDHAGAISVIRQVKPNGSRLAADLRNVLTAKDIAHYGEDFVSITQLKTIFRSARRLLNEASVVCNKIQ